MDRPQLLPISSIYPSVTMTYTLTTLLIVAITDIMHSFKHYFKSLFRDSLHHIAAFLGPHKWLGSSPKLWIIMYHRILPKTDHRYANEEPGMIVTPDDFEMHIQTLKKHFTFISLEEWVNKKNSNTPLPAKTCVLTFDDGWLDNYEFAWPILSKYNIPATIYLASGLIDTTTIFWPNRLIAIYQYLHSAPSATNSLDGFFDIFPQTDSGPLSSNFLTHAIYTAKQQTEATVIQAIDKAEATLFAHRPPSESELMTWKHINELSRSELITIGSHTQNHIKLDDSCNDKDILSEITDSKTDIQQHTHMAPCLFSYPYGKYNQFAKETVRSHYLCSTTTTNGINTLDTDLMELKRIRVHSDITNTPTKLLARMSGWF